MSNSLGKLFRITSFGESHGGLISIVVDGCPAGLTITEADIQSELDKRKPGTSTLTTPRKEEDRVKILSGILGEHTTGAPICLLVWNKNTDSGEYRKSKFLPRPGHADYTAYMKYGGFNDYRGGGIFSGRVTAGFVMAGAIARKLIGLIGLKVLAHTVEIGGIAAQPKDLEEIRENVAKNQVGCADPEAAREMATAIKKAKGEGDSLGGIIESIALNVPMGLGEPIFDTLEGELAKALFAIPAVKGVEFGSGFSAARKKGSENNDPFVIKDGKIVTTTNNAGGILGGISSGMPIVVRVAIKPTSSIAQRQQTVNMKALESANTEIKGRHDACIVPRAVVVVEAMTAITLADFALRAGLIPRVIK